MPKYAKYFKEISSNKGKLVYFAPIGLNEECSVMILKKFLSLMIQGVSQSFMSLATCPLIEHYVILVLALI